MRVARGTHAVERERARAGAHAIAGGEVVFDEHRQAVQRAAHAAGLALGIERPRDCQRVGIELDDAVELRAGPVDGGDARELLADELLAAQLAGIHGDDERRSPVLGARGGGISAGLGSGHQWIPQQRHGGRRDQQVSATHGVQCGLIYQPTRSAS